MATLNEDDFLNYETAAKLLKLPVGSLYGLVSKRQIPHIRINKRIVRFSRAELLDFLSTRKIGICAEANSVKK